MFQAKLEVPSESVMARTKFHQYGNSSKQWLATDDAFDFASSIKAILSSTADDAVIGQLAVKFINHQTPRQEG